MKPGKNMTLCKGCNQQIAKNAKACPHCGGKNKKPIYKKWWFWVIVVVVIGSGGSNMGNNRNAPSSPSTSQSVTISEEAKPDALVVDVDTLMDALASNALNASNTYKDQYVELTGKLATIDSSGAYFSLHPLDGRMTFTGVQCRITKEQQSIVANFLKEQEVTVIGTITTVGEVMGYSLKVESIK